MSNVKVTRYDAEGKPVNPEGVEGYRYIADRLRQAEILLNEAEIMPSYVRSEVQKMYENLSRLSRKVNQIANDAEKNGVEWALNEAEYRKK